MRLIITAGVQKKELEPLSRIFSKNDIIHAARKIARGLGIPIAHQKGNTLIKLALTSPGGAARTLWALRRNDGEVAILLLRRKNDEIGQNMSFSNPLFSRVLQQTLASLDADFTSGRFDIIEL